MRAAQLIPTFATAAILVCMPAIAQEDNAKRDVTRWISNLNDGIATERWNAAYRLGQLGSPAAPATDTLVKALGDDDFRVIWYSIHALGNIGEPAATAVPALREALSAEKEQTESNFVAVKALGDKYTRRFAARALGQIGSAAKAARPDLQRAMTSDDASLRVAAALALWQVAKDSAAVDVLSKMVASDDVNAAHEAALAFTKLGSHGEPGISSLVRALNSGTEDVRRSAARALGEMGPIAIPALTEALASKNVAVRRASTQALGWLGSAVSSKVLHNPDMPLSTFKKIYSQLNSSAVAALRVALADDDVDVRRLAAEAIGSIGPVAMPTLIAAIQSSDDKLRASAAVAIERVETRSPLDEITPEFADSFRRAAAEPLSEAIRSDDPFVRLYAVRMFASLGVARVAPGARPYLTRLLKDDNVQVRRYAFAALRQIRKQQSIDSTTTSEQNP